jgi:hypothetical protein
MSSKDKEYTFFDRKLILNNNNKSYSGIILPRPTLTDRERKEPDKCYAIMHYSDDNKITLNFCTQLQMLVEDVESEFTKSTNLK